MARKVFFSFHYKPDNWRASQVRQIGAVEGNQTISDNDWEAVTGGGDTKIKEWIDGQLSGKSCAVVLIGANTAGRKWINYEITTAWDAGKGVVGIHVHNLLNSSQEQASKGATPFDSLTFGTGTPKKLSTVVKSYDPPFTTSTYVYNHIKENIATWVDEAITIRNNV